MESKTGLVAYGRCTVFNLRCTYYVRGSFGGCYCQNPYECKKKDKFTFPLHERIDGTWKEFSK